MAVITVSHFSYKPCCVLAVWNPTMGQKMTKRHEDSPSGSDQTECGLHGSLHCSENSCNANKIIATFNITLALLFHVTVESLHNRHLMDRGKSVSCRDVVKIGRYSMDVM